MAPPKQINPTPTDSISYPNAENEAEGHDAPTRVDVRDVTVVALAATRRYGPTVRNAGGMGAERLPATSALQRQDPLGYRTFLAGVSAHRVTSGAS